MHRKLLLAALLVAGFAPGAWACSPVIRLDASGRIVPQVPRYSYVVQVMGQKEVTTPNEWGKPVVVQALDVQVLESASPEIEVGSRRTLHFRGLAPSCGPQPRSYTLDEYPVGTKWKVLSDYPESGSLEKRDAAAP